MRNRVKWMWTELYGSLTSRISKSKFHDTIATDDSTRFPICQCHLEKFIIFTVDLKSLRSQIPYSRTHMEISGMTWHIRGSSFTLSHDPKSPILVITQLPQICFQLGIKAGYYFFRGSSKSSNFLLILSLRAFHTLPFPYGIEVAFF